LERSAGRRGGALIRVGTDPSIEIEKERRNRLDELTAERGSGWEVPYQQGGFGCHELLDRTCLLTDQIEESILSQSSCVPNADWYALAARAIES
jgi:hypothetical protein